MTEQPRSDLSQGTNKDLSTVKAHRTRTVLTWVLVVLFAILTPLTIVSSWAVETVTNTDRYVATMHPLAHDPVIVSYIAQESTQKLFTQFKVEEKVKKRLPPTLGFLAAPLTTQLQVYTDKAVQIFLRSQAFQSFWDKENRYLQANLVAILEGKTPPPVSQTRAMIINVTPMIVTAIDQLDAKGITVFNPIRNELQDNRVLTLQLISPKQLATARTIFSLAILGRTTLFALTPITAIAALLIAWRRRVTALRLAVSGLLGSLLAAVFLTVLKSLFTNGAPGPQGPLAATHVFDTLFRYMKHTTTWLIVVFALLVVITWIIGPSSWATATRRILGSSQAKIAQSASEVVKSDAGQRAIHSLHQRVTWLGRRTKVFAWAGVFVAGLFLLMSSRTGGVMVTFLVLALYELVLGLIWLRTRGDGAENVVRKESAPRSEANDASSTKGEKPKKGAKPKKSKKVEAV